MAWRRAHTHRVATTRPYLVPEEHQGADLLGAASLFPQRLAGWSSGGGGPSESVGGPLGGTAWDSRCLSLPQRQSCWCPQPDMTGTSPPGAGTALLGPGVGWDPSILRGGLHSEESLRMFIHRTGGGAGLFPFPTFPPCPGGFFFKSLSSDSPSARFRAVLKGGGSVV